MYMAAPDPTVSTGDIARLGACGPGRREQLAPPPRRLPRAGRRHGVQPAVRAHRGRGVAAAQRQAVSAVARRPRVATRAIGRRGPARPGPARRRGCAPARPEGPGRGRAAPRRRGAHRARARTAARRARRLPRSRRGASTTCAPATADVRETRRTSSPRRWRASPFPRVAAFSTRHAAPARSCSAAGARDASGQEVDPVAAAIAAARVLLAGGGGRGRPGRRG